MVITHHITTQQCVYKRWPWIRSGGVDSGRILHFFRTRIQSQKFVENRTPSPFSILVAAGVCVVISEVKTWANFGWIDGSRSLNRSRILKFEKFPDPDLKILEMERSRGLKKWLDSGHLCCVPSGESNLTWRQSLIKNKNKKSCNQWANLLRFLQNATMQVHAKKYINLSSKLGHYRFITRCL